MKEEPSGATREAEATRETEPFTAFRVTSYPTRADHVQKTNGRMRYVLTRREIAGGTQRVYQNRVYQNRVYQNGVYRNVDEVEVALQNGGLRITTPEGRCGIKSEAGIIGLERALQEGLATIRPLPFRHQP